MRVTKEWADKYAATIKRLTEHQNPGDATPASKGSGGKRYNIVPLAKPRMTQRDKWAQRPCVVKYRDFKDRVRAEGVQLPESGCTVKYGLPMPSSWSKKKRREMDGQPHQQRPDVDNLLKALLDALFTEDAHIWDIRVTKVWAAEGYIEVVKR